MNVALNGFGRIGRAVMRIASQSEVFDVKAINTLSSGTEMMAYLLKHDTTYGHFPGDVEHDGKNLIVNGEKIACSFERDPYNIDWGAHDIDVVIDCTGAFRTREKLQAHLDQGAKKVILSCPAKDDSIPAIVLGVNDTGIDWQKEDIVSNASCTTNCVAPVMKVLEESIGVKNCLFTTIHAYTNSQSVLDEEGKTMTLSRSAANNLIPSTTGAAKSVAKVVPSLDGKIDGISIRTPLPAGSITDMSICFDQKTDLETIHKLLKEASEGELLGILGYAHDPCVSSDYIGSPYSSILDPTMSKQIGDEMFRLYAWYDNEWGYSLRLCEMVQMIGNKQQS